MDSLAVNSKEVKRETLRDPLLKLVYEMTMIGWLENVEQEDLKAYFLRRNEISYIMDIWFIPLNELHEGHTGKVMVKSLSRICVLWAGIDKV